jgi:acetyl-CoA decarbonylase/synthase complex subunit gamma
MLKVMDIFKYLPAATKKCRANCKKCGATTCMMFAMKVSKGELEIENCPFAPEELIEKINEAKKIQQETVLIGKIKVGGETVMYRHQKRFINPCPFFIKLDKLDETFEKIKNYKIEIIGNEFKIDGIFFENPTQEERKRRAHPRK